MVSESAKMSKQFTAGTTKNVTLTISQKLQIIGGLEVAKILVWLWLCTTLDRQLPYAIKQEGPNVIFYDIK